MDRYNTDSKYRKMVDDALSGGPSQKSLAMQKDLRKNPNLSVNELVKKTEENIAFDKKHPPLISTKAMLDNGLVDPDEVMVQYDSTTGLFTNKDKTIGFKDAITARKHNEVYEPYSPTVQKLKKSVMPTQANPQQMDYLKKNLEKMKYQNKPRGLNTVVYDGSKPFHKPTYRKGDAQIIINELERKKRLANPILKSEPLKLNTTPIPAMPVPTKEDPKFKELEARVMESKRRNEFEKTRGIANLFLK